jgi:excisionase family DNA binding protein
VSSVAPLVVKPRDACVMIGCGRKKLYQLLADKKLESFKDGYSRKITVESIKTYIAGMLEASRNEKLRRPS